MTSEKKNRLSLILLALLSVAGFLLSLVLTEHYFTLYGGAPEDFQSFCNLGGDFNCDTVALSQFAHIAKGFPISAVGAGWFLSMLLLVAFAWNQYWRRDALRIALAWSGLSLLFSVYTLSVMVFVVKTYCLLCLLVDATLVATFIVLFFLKSEWKTPVAFDRSKAVVMLPLMGGLVLSTMVFFYTFDSTEISQDDVNSWVQEVFEQRPVAVPERSNPAKLGTPGAPIQVIEYSDFQCPHCRTAAATLDTLLLKYRGLIEVEFRHFPLDHHCNPDMQRFSPHPQACQAAKIAICANRQGKFPDTYLTLFEKQSLFGSKDLFSIAESVKGLEISNLKSCVSSEETDQEIQEDFRTAKLLEITGTPMFFINGYRLAGAYPLPVWIAIIEKLKEKE